MDDFWLDSWWMERWASDRNDPLSAVDWCPIEDAAAHFDVSERTVESLLANNGVMPLVPAPGVLESRPPYPLGI